MSKFTKYEYRKVKDLKPVYDYYISIKNTVPYWFDADYNLWLESYESDTDYDGDIMFTKLITYAVFTEMLSNKSFTKKVGFTDMGRTRSYLK